MVPFSGEIIAMVELSEKFPLPEIGIFFFSFFIIAFRVFSILPWLI